MRSSFKFATLLVITSLIPTINAACCEDGWFAYNGHCYYIDMRITLRYSVAMRYCLHRGAYLVKLETPDENTFLKDYLKKIKASNTWIGLDDMLHEGIWQLIGTNQNVTFSDWAPIQPDNYNNAEHCAHFWNAAAYQWNDALCSLSVNFLCEKDSACLCE